MSPVGRGRETPLRPLRDHTKNMFYIYLLENRNDKSWYIGVTSNLKQRVKDHQSGKGGRTTRLKNNWRLIYFEGYLNKQDAIGREKFLKSGSGRNYLKKQLQTYLSQQ